MTGIGVQSSACILAVSTVGLLYRDFYVSLTYLFPLTAAAVVGGLLAVVCAVRRWRWTATVSVASIGFLGLMLYTAYFDSLDYFAPGFRAIQALGLGLVRGWARMMTVGLPAEASGELVITPALLAWTAAFVSVTLLARSKSLLAPAAAPTGIVVIGLSLVGGLHADHLLPVSLFVSLMLGLLLVRAGATDTATARQTATSRQLAGGLPMVLAVAAAAVGVGWVLTSHPIGDRADLRSLYPQQIDVHPGLTPLATIKGQLRESPPRSLFTISFSAADTPSAARVRVAVLDAFDGAIWTSSGNHLVAARELPGDPGLIHARRVNATVSVKGLGGQFLPCVGWPVTIDVTGEDPPVIGFNAATGTLISERSTVDGLTYSLVSDVAEDAVASAMKPSSGARFDRFTRLPPGNTPELGEMAARLTAKTVGSYEKLVALEGYLRTLPYSLDARPGHSYAVLHRMLTADTREGQVGYAEQRAAAFAVLARTLGFPTRVAVGYRIEGGEAGGPAAVTTAHAHAWAEVHFDGYGWVGFDPTNVNAEPTQAPRQSPAPLRSADQSNPQPSAAAVPDPAAAGPGATGGEGWGTGLFRAAIGAAVTLLMLILLTCAAIVGEKRRRRLWRRRFGDNAARVVGAWQEALDRLDECGLKAAAFLTPRETARHAAHSIPAAADAVTALAELVTTALFGGAAMTADQARAAWRLEDKIRAVLLPRWPPWRRLRALLNPAPLIGGWRRRRDRRAVARRLKGATA